jgi:hypothetical protein
VSWCLRGKKEIRLGRMTNKDEDIFLKLENGQLLPEMATKRQKNVGK